MNQVISGLPMPKGPYPTLELDFWVKSKTPGAFVLSNDGKTASYIGVSLEDVKKAIREVSSKNEPEYFGFFYAESLDFLYELECWWYHNLKSSQETKHPSPPRGREHAKCPVPGCPLSD